ncbi:MAG: transcription elongation factor GreA [Candidatus Pacebacteria bacterium]|nr:transcription elongation factor GreA [Candidatus Paceibacterota bacterium]
MSEQLITQEGYDKLKKELDHLIDIKRREIADRIEKAKELGDLSENAEYNEAKDAQALNDSRIVEVSNILKNVTVVDGSGSSKEVSMGSVVTAKTGNKQKVFTIVSFNEADPLEGKISNESPLGIAFLGKKKGEEVIVNTPKGEVKYKIIKIQSNGK